MNIKAKYLLMVVILFTSVINGQNQEPQKKTIIGTKDSFHQDILNFRSDKKGQTKVEVFIQVPYSSILFVKTDDGFHGLYTITVSFLNEKGEKLFSEKIWKEKIFVKDFKTTSSKKISNISRRTFYLQPGMYLVRTSVEDKETKKEFVKTIKFIVRDFSQDVSLSSILFIVNTNVKNGNRKIVPNVSRNVANQKNGIPIYYQLYSNKKMDAIVYYIISDKEEDDIFKESESIKVDSGINNIFYTAKDLSINLGTYQFSIVIKNNDDDKLAETKKIFFSKWVGAPSNIEDLETAIDQLEYIATDDQKDYIEEGKTKEERIKRYMEFWKYKDPNPIDDENEVFNEYYRRINLANNNFSHYNRPGWKTDRGMVFIVLGPPNNIDSHPFDSFSKPFVVWEYYDLNRSFTFTDITGFGDFRLANPLDFNYFRYR
ncbi:MAG: GWxTD domain-containing protein [Bacteroidetes bacterium]|nr:GWxTD domain-containing protein [Bacteroidota bacterium]